MKKLTPTMKRAIAWAEERGGYVVITSNGKMMAEGEVAGFEPSTWLRLVCYGYMVKDFDGHLRLTYGGE